MKVRARIPDIRDDEVQDVFFVLQRENDEDILLMLADKNGVPMTGTEILRICPAYGTDKLKIARILGREDTGIEKFFEIESEMGQVSIS